MNFHTRLFVIDTETTGVDPLDDRIVELGAVYFENGEHLQHHRMLLDPGRPIPPDASEVHGITDARVAGKPTFRGVAASFVTHLDGSALAGPPPLVVGYNAVAFDAPLINAELARADLPERIDLERVVDPLVFLRWYERGVSKLDLGTVCKRYGIPLTGAHSAVADAKATAAILFALIERGHISDDVDEALAVQEDLALRIEAERERFSYWLYLDREDGSLRMGAGKYLGRRLEDVDDPGYFRFLLDKVDDLPEQVRACFVDEAE